MQTIATATIDAGFYGDDAAQVQLRTRGPHAGTFRVIGGGFAGRIAYRTAEAAKSVVERHARFKAWR